jgi:thiol-disulfide isomerase/thioredoxin
MSCRAVLLGLVFCFAYAGQSANGQLLKLGDDAPRLEISDWVKGDPVDLGKLKGKGAVLIEFWATWCPPCIASIPHLTELQRKYGGQGLTVVGVSGPGRGETLKKVERFVRKRGDAMDYTVAYDGGSKANDAYMRGVGMSGIPAAFLVDKQGKLVWYGHPEDPMMDEIVSQVVKGAYDASDAILQETLDPSFAKLNRFHRKRDWDGFVRTAKTILEMDPKNETAIGALVYAYVYELEDGDGLRAFSDVYVKANGENAAAMKGFADALLQIAELDLRQPELALEVARKAYEACKGGDCGTVETYARAMFEIGMLDRAIELQEQAVALGSDDGQREMLEKVADFYRKCKSLQTRSL